MPRPPLQTFNPLDKRHLGESVANALVRQPICPLPLGASFPGAGIYALYYGGALPCYGILAERNRGAHFDLPIYVGKAVPTGARKGGFGLDLAPGPALFGRLADHAKSIEQTHSLFIGDFRCRYLITDDIWIPLGESLLIEQFQPLWNILVDGFGNHDPGKGRSGQKRSRWDELHPGRSWASLLQPCAKTAEEIGFLVADFLEGKPVPTIPVIEAALAVEDESDE